MAQTWKRLGVHKPFTGVKITESVNIATQTASWEERRYTATILGWRNWKLGNDFHKAISRAREIRDRIEAGDESVFVEPNEGSRT